MDLPFYMKKDVVFNNYKLYVINLSIRMQSDLGKRETNTKQQITPRSKLYKYTYYVEELHGKKAFCLLCPKRDQHQFSPHTFHRLTRGRL